MAHFGLPCELTGNGHSVARLSKEQLARSTSTAQASKLLLTQAKGVIKHRVHLRGGDAEVFFCRAGEQAHVHGLGVLR